MLYIIKITGDGGGNKRLAGFTLERAFAQRGSLEVEKKDPKNSNRVEPLILMELLTALGQRRESVGMIFRFKVWAPMV